ncbi:MAG: hypothetical protein ACUVYA_12955 [Planctomycetota bacterium]
MIWKEHDFAREVCRQLVELASIRKRISGDAELLERVQSLEASHRGLLRKLDESYRERRAAQGAREEAEGPVRCRVRAARAVRRSRRAPAPRLDETCGSCGRALLSGVLDGEDIVWRAGRWHHRRCAPLAEDGSPRGVFN